MPTRHVNRLRFARQRRVDSNDGWNTATAHSALFACFALSDLPRRLAGPKTGEGRPLVRIDLACRTLLWCTILNYSFVVLWFLLYLSFRRWLQGLWGRWFHLTAEQFDVLNFGGMALYKVGILLLNLVPYIALRIAG
jgi:hypothetical protein